MSFKSQKPSPSPSPSPTATAAIACGAWTANLIDRARTECRDRYESEDGLTTLEWALLVAGVAAMAIALIVVVRNNVDQTQQQIPTNVDTGTSF